MSDPTSRVTGSVLVVGAGPVGLTMAAHLHHHGLTPRVVDRAPQATTTSKALAIWPRSLEMLDGLGLADAFLAAGMTIDAATIHSGGRVLARIEIHAEGTAFPRPLMLAQSETERLLAEHLRGAGIEVERPVELVRFADRGDHVATTLRHEEGREEEVRCDWLLGTDGAHSTVRHGLDVAFTGEADPNDWVLADCRIEGIPHDSLSLFWHARGVLVFFPFAKDRCRVIADMGRAEGAGRPADPTLAEVQAIIDARGPGDIRLSDPVWLAGFRIHERKVAEYVRGRCVLAGDAAHIHSPAGGQGMNTGMQDAWNLAWKLALVQSGRGQASPLLGSYQVERSAVGEMVLRNASRLTGVATLRNPIGRFVRNRIVGALGLLPAFRRAFAATLTELAIHYPESPLNGESSGTAWTPGGLRPGDRVPDVTLRTPGTGEERRLLSILRDPRHSLLLIPADGTRTADLVEIGRLAEATYPGAIRAHLIAPAAGDGLAPDWLDPEGSLRRSLGATGPALALVRPDGYLGYRGQPASWDDLRGHLDRYLVPAIS